MVQNCPRCGTANTGGHRYCSNCGAQVLDIEERRPSPILRPRSSAEVPAITDPASAEMRADLPPNAGERAPGQATFVPYDTDVVRKIEKQKTTNGWLMPTIFIAGALLFLLVGVTVFLLLSNGNRPPTQDSQIASGGSGGVQPTVVLPPTALPQPTAARPPTVALPTKIAVTPLRVPQAVTLPCVPPEGATPEQAVIYRVCRSSEEQIQAWRNLDTEVLKGSRTGSDLEENIERVEKYKADKQYADPKLLKLTVVGLQIDGESALVRTTEEWSVTTYSSVDNKVLGETAPSVYSEVYHLVLQGEKWLLAKVVFENLP